ncbi:hypothetical protein GLX27_000476 [Malassezia furfur]|uniref:PAS domain-containing protein n=1 Tax=Malassezia furfur TaxID=55194 RepID=A0ABY8EJJ9_MALFU|nr:hypothetical protein CBS14141_001843 [Malassezia furfur]WFD45851.1 hypothetical protein GLX27_000476 [Malassezia furfur]
MPQAYALPQQGAEDNAHSRRPPLTWTAASRGSHDVVDDRSKYSHSGINILDILTRVSQRTSPQVSLGPVDMTCAMSVAHVTFNNASRMLQIEFGDVSDEFLRLVGQTRDRVLGQAPASVLPCADYEVQRVRRMYAAAANGIEQQAVMELIGPKQRSLYVLMTLIPLRYMGRRDLRHDNRGVEWIVGFQAEVTPDMLPHTLSLIDNSEGPLDPIAPHKPAIEAPTKAEPSEAPHEWQDLVAETGDAGTVYFVTWHDVLQYVSTSVESQLGYRADELIGKPVEDLCHPNDMVALFRELKGIKNKTGKMPNARARFPVKPVRLDENVSQHMVLAEVNGLLRFKHKTEGSIWMETSARLVQQQGAPGRRARSVIAVSGWQHKNGLASKPELRDEKAALDPLKISQSPALQHAQAQKAQSQFAQAEQAQAQQAQQTQQMQQMQQMQQAQQAQAQQAQSQFVRAQQAQDQFAQLQQAQAQQAQAQQAQARYAQAQQAHAEQIQAQQVQHVADQAKHAAQQAQNASQQAQRVQKAQQTQHTGLARSTHSRSVSSDAKGSMSPPVWLTLSAMGLILQCFEQTDEDSVRPVDELEIPLRIGFVLPNVMQQEVVIQIQKAFMHGEKQPVSVATWISNTPVITTWIPLSPELTSESLEQMGVQMLVRLDVCRNGFDRPPHRLFSPDEAWLTVPSGLRQNAPEEVTLKPTGPTLASFDMGPLPTHMSDRSSSVVSSQDFFPWGSSDEAWSQWSHFRGRSAEEPDPLTPGPISSLLWSNGVPNEAHMDTDGGHMTPRSMSMQNPTAHGADLSQYTSHSSAPLAAGMNSAAPLVGMPLNEFLTQSGLTPIPSDSLPGSDKNWTADMFPSSMSSNTPSQYASDMSQNHAHSHDSFGFWPY